MFVYAFCALIQLRLVQQQVLLTMLLVLQMVRHGQQPYQLLVQTMLGPLRRRTGGEAGLLDCDVVPETNPGGGPSGCRGVSTTASAVPDSKNSDPVTTTLSVAVSADAAEPAPSG